MPQAACKSEKNDRKEDDVYNYLKNDRDKEIFQDIIRYEFSSCSQEEKERIFNWLGVPSRYVGYDKKKHEEVRLSRDIVACASMKLNMLPIQAACEVGARLNITVRKCFDVVENNNVPALRGGKISGRIFKQIPDELKTSRKIYRLVGTDCQLDMGGEIEQVVCHYSAVDGDNFFLIASRVAVGQDFILKIGFGLAIAWPFSRQEIATARYEFIIFPMSLPVAFHFRKLCHETKDYNHNRNAIVSGHFGRIDALDTECFNGKSVILLPEFSRDGYLSALNFTAQLKSIARDVKIYPWPIMADGMPDEAMTAGAGSPWKQSLLEQKVDLREELAPSSLLNRITNKALSRSSFKKLLAEIGLSLAGEEASQEDYEALPVSTLGEVANSPAIDIDAEPSLDLLIKPHYILFMWGGSHSGKSFILLTLILGVATGTRAFCLSGSTQPRKVLLLDGELTKDQFMQRLGQLTQNNRALLDSASKNICCYFAREAGSLDLLNPDHQKSILARIKKDGIEVLAIDNLISLADSALKGGSGKLFDFFYAVEREGVAVVFVSHATKGNAQSKGSVDIESKSQTIIQIQGRNVLNRDNDISDAVKLALEKGEDIVVRLTFDKCKLPPKLNNKYEVYHLPVDGNWNYIEGNVSRDKPLDITTFGKEMTNAPNSSSERLNSSNAVIDNLSEDSRLLYEMFQDGKKYSRAEVEARFNWGEDKAGNELKNLKKVGLITPIGSGRTTAYRKK
ncbi:AAA family ATPase [Desulfovibrio sp.]|uniref:AAA family ATPase n=1 Tax=Desulfovibrio sp. TaxID=885 RepID=UPI0025C32ED7|nr:AAA family ATPase [Desulfovibrio sp.]